MSCSDARFDAWARPGRRAVRIGYVVKRFPRLSETFIQNELLELERQGVQLEIFSLKRPLEEPRHPMLAALRARVTYLAADATNSSAELDAITDSIAGLSPSKDRADRRMLAAKSLHAARLATAYEIQHLHAHFASDATTVALLAARAAGLSFSFTAHARDIYHCYVSSEVDDAARRRKISAARFVTTVSEFNRRHLCRLAGIAHGHKIMRLYNGIDVGKFQPRLPHPPSTRRVLFVGRLVAKKGVGDLVEACRILKERSMRFECRIIGEGPLREQLAEQIASCGLTHEIIMSGALDQDAVLEAMRGARVLALPSVVTDSGDRDGLPTVLLEALAVGLPVVSTNVAGIPEIIEPETSGLLVEPSSPARIAAAISRILNDDALASRLAETGRRKAIAMFDLSSNIALLRRKFENATRNHRSAYFLDTSADGSMIQTRT